MISFSDARKVCLGPKWVFHCMRHENKYWRAAISRDGSSFHEVAFLWEISLAINDWLEGHLRNVPKPQAGYVALFALMPDESPNDKNVIAQTDAKSFGR